MGAGRVNADALPAATETRRRRKEISVMQAYAIYSAYQALGLANDRLGNLRAEAAASRLAEYDGRHSSPGRIAAVVGWIRSAIASATETAPVVPRLTDFPTRG
jgi:hypothetical protein